MRGPVPCFVDTGAWIALAITTDPLHERAVQIWNTLMESHCAIFTSLPIVLETFTFLQRHTDQETALLWKDEIEKLAHFSIWECTKRDLRDAWNWFGKKNLYKLSAVDATSFTLMKRHKVHRAFTFDSHFSVAGFQMA